MPSLSLSINIFYPDCVESNFEAECSIPCSLIKLCKRYGLHLCFPSTSPSILVRVGVFGYLRASCQIRFIHFIILLKNFFANLIRLENNEKEGLLNKSETVGDASYDKPSFGH